MSFSPLGRLYAKWLCITLICGGHSFISGYVNKASMTAMLAAIFSLAAVMTLVERHVLFQKLRAADSRWAKALRWALWLRLIWAVAALAGAAIMHMPHSDKTAPSVLGVLVTIPAMLELFIGAVAVSANRFLTGVEIMHGSRMGQLDVSPLEWWFASYSTSVLTGLIHIALLALACVMIYLLLRLKARLLPVRK